MFHHRKPRVVAVITIERCKPEELVTANPASHADTPCHLVVRRGVGLRRSIGTIIKEWRRDQRGWRSLCDPLGKGIPRAPGVLAVEEKPLPMQLIGAALGLHVHAPTRSPGCGGLPVAGPRLHRTARRL